jgi:trk system potassium uptake protein TrkH
VPAVTRSSKRRAGGRFATLKTVIRDVGALQILVGALMSLPLLVSLLYREWYSALAFLVGGALASLMGALAYGLCENAREPTKADSMTIAAAGWLTTAVFGAVPFVVAAYATPHSVLAGFVPAGADYSSSLLNFRDPLHALFESMSGYTTTGLTMSVHEPSVGHGFLWYRSQMQWVGGAGMIVLSLAILRQPHGPAGRSLYQSEARSTRLRPSIASTAQAIWKIYLGLTLLVAVYLTGVLLVAHPGYGLENAVFDALNHAMTGQSTGGFSTLDDSIAGYGSYLIEVLHVPAMVTGAVAIPVYYAASTKRSLRPILEDPQVRVLAVSCLVGVAILSLFLTGFVGLPYTGDLTSWLADVLGGQAFRDGLFQYISAATTTGWQTSAIGDWPPGAVLFIVIGAMLAGGSAGATVGGIKLSRIYVLFRGIAAEIMDIFLPEHALESLQVGQIRLSEEEANVEIRAAALFTFLYLVVLAISLFVLLWVLPPEYSLADAIFEVATAQGTVGLSTGITAPSMPTAAEVLFIVQMWMGRLEIIPVLVFVRNLARS